MKDSYEREINYLRLSLTQRCQLDCIYCQNHAKLENEELTLEEIVRIVTCMAKLGINRIRLTGGEPLVRKDIVPIIKAIHGISNIQTIGLTTNGILLGDNLAELVNAGISCINVSLDTLQRERFFNITGYDGFDKVMYGIKKTIAMGIPLKINVVLMRGCNEEETDAFIELTKYWNIDVRFIELMPMDNQMNKKMMDLHRVSGKEILLRYPALVKETCDYQGQPAKLYRMPGYQGRVGFINPVSQCFCQDCNRIRIQSNGMIRLCLGSDKTVSIREALQLGDQELEQILYHAILEKPKKSQFIINGRSNNSMSQIGG